MGPALGAGVGYDWWAGPEVALGVLGRLWYVGIDQHRGTGNVIALGAILNFTYH